MRKGSACPLCNDAKTLRCAAPARFEVFAEAVSHPLDSGIRTYPCPACNKAPAYELLRILTVVSEPQADRPEAAKYVRREQALALADEMLRTDAITFERRDTGTQSEFRSTAAVVSPTFVATLGKRLEERQAEFADEAAIIARRSIYNWGSYHGDAHINKDTAARLITEAIRTAAERRKSWTEWNGQSPATSTGTAAEAERMTEPPQPL